MSSTKMVNSMPQYVLASACLHVCMFACGNSSLITALKSLTKPLASLCILNLVEFCAVLFMYVTDVSFSD